MTVIQQHHNTSIRTMPTRWATQVIKPQMIEVYIRVNKQSFSRSTHLKGKNLRNSSLSEPVKCLIQSPIFPFDELCSSKIVV